MERAERAVQEIWRESRSLNVLCMQLDLASLRSIREFSKAFLQKEKRLDILINNAGMPSVLDWTEDGFSMCFGVNHLGHFLLTNLLLDRLKDSAPSRVVSISSDTYKYQKLDLKDLNYNVVPFFTYCRSKLANIYFTQELARRMEGTGVTAFAVHPGYVFSNWASHFSLLFRLVASVVMTMFFVSCEMGAQTTIQCAVSDEVLKHNGKEMVDKLEVHLRARVDTEGAHFIIAPAHGLQRGVVITHFSFSTQEVLLFIDGHPAVPMVL
uniref:Si:dkey-174n20.1 n=1 Tax=Latimeria chalumnae TaxID=7897 RepID=M3XI98_LATCH